MGGIFQSWDLIQKSFAVLKSDKQLLIFPAASGVACLAVSACILATFGLAYPEQISALLTAGSSRVPMANQMTNEMWTCMFFFYLANYFIVIFFNVGLVSAASDRLAGGPGTVNQGLRVAWSRKGSIFQWALLSATIGVLLNAVERRLSFVKRLIVSLLGAAWGLATVFVVPLLAVEDIGPVEALQRSAELMTKTWGEQLTGGVTFAFYFVIFAIPALLIPIAMYRAFGMAGGIAGAVLAVVYWLLLSAISSAVKIIFITALYRYATTDQTLGGFRRGDFSTVWQPKH